MCAEEFARSLGPAVPEEGNNRLVNTKAIRWILRNYTYCQGLCVTFQKKQRAFTYLPSWQVTNGCCITSFYSKIAYK